MHQCSVRSGFTLLEVLLSVALLALMALMITRIFSESTRAIKQGSNLTMLDETARVLLDTLERDISQALIRTNVAFRVTKLDDSFDQLYFVSSGIRRQSLTIPRDTAPIQISRTMQTLWDHQMVINSPSQVSGTTPRTIPRLMNASDYYLNTDQERADFQTAEGSTSIAITSKEYTPLLENTVSDYTMLTSLRITVNGNPSWNGTKANGLLDPNNMPRFLDLQIGLAPSSVIRQARTLFQATNPLRGRQLIIQNERIFSRRIFMRNSGLERITL